MHSSSAMIRRFDDAKVLWVGNCRCSGSALLGVRFTSYILHTALAHCSRISHANPILVRGAACQRAVILEKSDAAATRRRSRDGLPTSRQTLLILQQGCSPRVPVSSPGLWLRKKFHRADRLPGCGCLPSTSIVPGAA